MASAYTKPNGLLLWLSKFDISAAANALFFFIVSCAFNVPDSRLVMLSTQIHTFFIILLLFLVSL